MENQTSSRTTKSDIVGTVYVVESRISDSAKESAYSKLKRLITVNAKSLVFGDLSYYWLIERQPITIKKLSELYALQGQIGFSAYERLDGKLIQPDALKILQIKA